MRRHGDLTNLEGSNFLFVEQGAGIYPVPADACFHVTAEHVAVHSSI